MSVPALAALLALGSGLPSSEVETKRCSIQGDVALPDAGGYPDGARLVWVDGAYTMVWSERPSNGDRFELWVARLGPNGRLVQGSMRRIFDDLEILRFSPDLAVGDGAIGIIYRRVGPEDRVKIPDDRKPPAAQRPRPSTGRMRSLGEPPRPAVEPPALMRKPPSLVQGPKRPPGEMQVPVTFFVRIDPRGEVLGPEVRVSPPDRRGGDHASIAWDAHRRSWGFVFESQTVSGGDSRVVFTRRTDDLMEAPLELAGPAAYLGDGRSFVAQSGGGFVVVWTDPTGLILAEIDHEVRRAKISKDGVINPAVATDGRTHVVAWRGTGVRGPMQVAQVRDGRSVTPDGFRPVSPPPVSTPPRFFDNPAVRLVDDAVELVWVVLLDGKQRLFRSTGDGSASLVQTSSSSAHAGWPRWLGDGPCRGALIYQRFGFGSGSETRIQVR